MYRDTGSPEWVSALFVAEFAPAVVIGVLFAGRLDRLAPRRALVISDLVCAACFVVLATVHQPAAVIALATVAGAAVGVFRPVALASVPVLVEEPELDAANGALTAVDTFMTTVGQAVSGILLTLIGRGRGVVRQRRHVPVLGGAAVGVPFADRGRGDRARGRACSATSAAASRRSCAPRRCCRWRWPRR